MCGVSHSDALADDGVRPTEEVALLSRDAAAGLPGLPVGALHHAAARDKGAGKHGAARPTRRPHILGGQVRAQATQGSREPANGRERMAVRLTMCCTLSCTSAPHAPACCLTRSRPETWQGCRPCLARGSEGLCGRRRSFVRNCYSSRLKTGAAHHTAPPSVAHAPRTRECSPCRAAGARASAAAPPWGPAVPHASQQARGSSAPRSGPGHRA